MYASYIAGQQNSTLVDKRAQAEVDAAITAFKRFLDKGELTENITNVHFFRRQDKAAAGKGNIGDTLDTRSVQANFIATWGGTKINVHVDISD